MHYIALECRCMHFSRHRMGWRQFTQITTLKREEKESIKHCRIIYLVAVHSPPEGGKVVGTIPLGFPGRWEQEERTEETIKQHWHRTKGGFWGHFDMSLCAMGSLSERYIRAGVGVDLTQILLLNIQYDRQAQGSCLMHPFNMVSIMSILA